MNSLIILAIIGFVIVYRAGPAKRAQWKRQIERSLEPQLTRVREHPSTPERFRATKPVTPPRIIGRGPTTPPPPTGTPVSPPPPSGAPTRFPPRSATSSRLPPPPGAGARPAPSTTGNLFRRPEPDETEVFADDEDDANVLEVDLPPGPGDPVIAVVVDEPIDDIPEPADVSEPVEIHEAPDDPQPADVSEPTEIPETDAAAPDLSKDSVIAALFGRDRAPHVRKADFDARYAGEPVEWTVTVVRTAKGRRHREPALRAELVLGYTSERQMFSDRVVAEAFFPIDTEIERDTEQLVTGTLAEANVYANRLVLDGARLG